MSAITMDMVSSNYIDYPCHYVLDRNALRLQKVDWDLSCHDTTDPHHEVNSNLTIIGFKIFACGAIKNRGGGRLKWVVDLSERKNMFQLKWGST